MGPPHVRRRLARLAELDVNFSPAVLEHAEPSDGWVITDLRQALAGEGPGMPVGGGSWEIAQRLMRGYEFADPSIVRAYYDPDVPLRRRNMLLKLQALGVLHLFVGVRVADVYETTLERDGRSAHVWGWSYRTLQGHVEMGQMDWQVWKWLDSGDVEFRVHSVSRAAPVANPAIRLGFRVLEGRERRAFLESTRSRMRRFVELALQEDGREAAVRAAAQELTARPQRGARAAHDALARSLSD